MSDPRFYRAPFAPPVVVQPPRPEAVAIQGKRTQLQVTPSGANFIAKTTTLISARVNSPRQWMITVAQIAKTEGSVPWQMVGTATEGGATYGPAFTTAPELPAPSQALQLALQWAAGGASFQTRFDYPAMGGVFGVTADTLDLSVVFKEDPAGTPYASMSAVPVVGAFMVEGKPSDATPLRWLESHGGSGAGANAFYTVKPYARRLRITFDTGAAGSSGVLQAKFLDAAANAIMTRQIAASTAEVLLDVPAQAVGFAIGGANVNTFQLEWQIGLA